MEREETISVEYIAREHEMWDVKIGVAINWGDEEVRELKRWEGDREEQPFENVLRQRIKYETSMWEHVSVRELNREKGNVEVYGGSKYDVVVFREA